MKRFVFAAVLALLPAMALAQQKAGQWDFSLGGGGVSDNDIETGSANVTFLVGYFISKELEVGLIQGWSYVDVDVDTAWSANTSLFGAFHFDLNAVQPFIGPVLGYGGYGDNAAQDEWYYGVLGGVKWYVKPEVYIYGSVQYQRFFDELDDGSEGAFQYNIGIGFVF